MAKKMTVASVMKLAKPTKGKKAKKAKTVKASTTKLVFGSPEWRAKYGKKTVKKTKA